MQQVWNGVIWLFFYPEGIDLHARIPFHSIPSLGDGLIYTEILSQRAVKPKQPSYQLLVMNLMPRLVRSDEFDK